MTFRRRQRSRQHEAAHSGEQSHPPPLQHPAVPPGDPELLDDAHAVADFLAHARAKGTFAFDTEFIGEVAYLPKTCLIQLGTDERVGLVDPTLIGDLGPIWELVADPAVTTLVHAGASDLSPVRRHLAATTGPGEPRNVIDVQVAAGFAGMPYPASLAKLVERFAGHPLAKGHTFTDWDSRPLTSAQLRYAADDVRYLPLVWSALRTELERSGRLAWAIGETARRIADPHVFDARSQAWRASRGYELDPGQEALLEALCVTRDAIAQAEDLPHRATIPDGSLLEIVRHCPSSAAGLVAIRGMPRPVVARHGERLLATLAANPSQPADWFRVRRRREDDPEARASIDRVLAAANARCAELGIAASLALTRADAEAWMRRSLAAKARGEPAPHLFAEEDWRREAFPAIDELPGG